jgi:HAMP domain-containing protein
MLHNLKLGSKFNLLLVTVFLIGILISGATLAVILNRSAENQVTSKALILIQTINSVRNYTQTQIFPLLKDRLKTEPEFVRQTIAAHSAREVFENLRSKKDYSDFFYKEATLNPTNLRDKADDFETEIVQRFRNDPNLKDKEITGFRTFPGGNLYYIARPIEIKDPTCLECHDTPERAPKSLLTTYGRENGFGWKLNEIVGAQIISVPSSEVANTTRQSLLLVMGAVGGIFAVTILLINLMLRQAVIDPLNRMSMVAHDVSIGKLDSEFQQTSHDEIGVLASAFNRMKLSLSMAMDMLNKQ